MSSFKFSMPAIAAIAGLVAGCSDDSTEQVRGRYALGSIVIDADGARTMYVQAIDSLEAGPFTNERAIELPGNGVILASGASFYVGLAQEPTWVRYTLGDDGAITETGRLSFLRYGVSAIDFGNVIVDEQTAVSVLSGPAIAVIWNPSTLEIRGEVSLSHLLRAGYDLEVWTTTARDGLVYIPGRWADWDGARIYPGASLTIVDPVAQRIVGIAEDDRCASSGRAVFDDAGYAYVMGDGRNYAIQTFAHASGSAVPENCLLRIAPGQTDFEAGYFYTIPSLTGGLQSITELGTARQGSGIGFAKMFYPDQLPPGVEPTDFKFWLERAHKMWRIHLADPPRAEEVSGVPFSSLGFDSSVLGGKLFTGESPDGGATSEIYEIDPDTNTATPRFTMAGIFYGLYELRAP